MFKTLILGLVFGLVLGFVGSTLLFQSQPTYHDVVAQSLIRGCDPLMEYALRTEDLRAQSVQGESRAVQFVKDTYADAQQVRIETYTVPPGTPITEHDPTLTVLQVLTYKRCLPGAS